MVVSLIEIFTERRRQMFYKPINVHSVRSPRDLIEVSMIFLGGR